MWEAMEWDARGTGRQDALMQAGDRSARRSCAELVRLRAGLLVGEDRALLETYFKGGSTVRQIARLRRVGASTIWRRLRRIVQRLCDPTYALCLRDRGDMTVLDLVILKDHFVRGLSAASISRSRNLSYYRVRRTILEATRRTATAAARRIETTHRVANPQFQDQRSRPKAGSPI